MEFKCDLYILSLSILFTSFANGKSLQVYSDADDQWYAGGIPGFDYDCSNKVNGNYPHPTKCHNYVACVNQSHAYEMQCGFNSQGQLLHFVASSGPNPATSYCDVPQLAGCVITSEPTTPNPLPNCTEHDCKQVGNCKSYHVCKHGVLMEYQCGQNLFWNPDVPNGFGGSCDFFNSLLPDRQEMYKSDHNCIPPCEWFQYEDEICTGRFNYRLPFNATAINQLREIPLTCPSAPEDSGAESLIWNNVTLTCDRRSNVQGCNNE